MRYAMKSFVRSKSTFLPDTTVTGPVMVVNGCLVKFLINDRIRVVFPTFDGPTTAITIGGGSSGERSTIGMCCFFVVKS